MGEVREGDVVEQDRRKRRQRMVAWIAIFAMVATPLFGVVLSQF